MHLDNFSDISIVSFKASQTKRRLWRQSKSNKMMLCGAMWKILVSKIVFLRKEGWLELIPPIKLYWHAEIHRIATPWINPHKDSQRSYYLWACRWSSWVLCVESQRNAHVQIIEEELLLLHKGNNICLSIENYGNLFVIPKDLTYTF